MALTTLTPTNIGTTQRVVTAVAAAAALAAAARVSRGRLSLAAASAALLVRAATGYCPIVARTRQNGGDTKRWLSGARGVHLQAVIRIDRSPDEVYAFWRDFDRLSQALPPSVSVAEVDERRTEWSLGDTAHWTAEIIHEEPGRLIGWQTLPGADIVSAGSVRFNPSPDHGTDLVVRMQYSPPLGRLGAALAELFGKGAGQIVDDSLAAAKRALEGASASHAAANPIIQV